MAEDKVQYLSCETNADVELYTTLHVYTSSFDVHTGNSGWSILIPPPPTHTPPLKTCLL